MSTGDDPAFLEAGIDFESANAARMYDYYLGGAHHFAVDRERADAAIAAHPHLPALARANRAFLGRVVRWCVVERGIDQFLDLGSGVPTVGNVHEVAHRHDPGARVAYVDFEPVAVAHATTIVADLGLGNVSVTRADAREPDSVLGAHGVTDLLDLDRPVALLAMALLQFVAGDVADLVAWYRARLVPGSVLAISHISDDVEDPVAAAEIRAVCAAYATSATPAVPRDRAELTRTMTGLDLVAPGLVDLVDWPERSGAPPSCGYGAVGIVPG